MEGVYILFNPKIAVGRKGTRRLRVYAQRLRATLIFSAQKQHPDTPGNGVRSIRPYTRSIRVRQGETSVYGSFELFCGSQSFV